MRRTCPSNAQYRFAVVDCIIMNYKTKKQSMVKARIAFLLSWTHREDRGHPNIFNPLPYFQPGSVMRPGLSVATYSSLTQLICSASPVSIFLPYKEKDPNKPTKKHLTEAKTKQKTSLQRLSLLDFFSRPIPACNFHKGKTNTKDRKIRGFFYT